MAKNHVHQILRQKLNIRNQGDDENKPILEATKVQAKMGKHRLLGLNFKTSQVGFILDRGFVGVRDGSTILLQASRYNKSSTTRKSHDVNMPAKDLFVDIYKQSGALEFLLKTLRQTRTDFIKVQLSDLVLELNKEGNGKT